MSSLRAKRSDERKHSASQNVITCPLLAREGAGRSLFLAGTVVSVMFTMLPGETSFAMGQGGQALSEQGTVTAPASPAPMPVKATIKDILTGSVKSSSPEVIVKGVFKGWKGTCPSSSLLTRSDWILEDETGCIYVSGFLLPGLSPAQPNNEHIVVTGGIVRGKGSLVLKATGVTKVHE